MNAILNYVPGTRAAYFNEAKLTGLPIEICETLEEAILSHERLKHDVRRFVEVGENALKFRKLHVDGDCSFGKWLVKRELPLKVKSSVEYKNVRRLHSEFHRVAAQAVSLASHDKMAEALQLIGVGSKFVRTSNCLRLAMICWRDKIRWQGL